MTSYLVTMYFILTTLSGAPLKGSVSVDSRPGRVGILYNRFNHKIYEVCKDSPAHKEGLKKGDTVEGYPKFRGPTGGIVLIKVRRKTPDGIQHLKFYVERIANEDCSNHYVD